MFKDRIDAANQLANRLSAYKNKESKVVLAVPRGGLPLGAIIAKALGADLDVALSKKIGHPYNKEYAIGAVSLESVILNEDLDIPKTYIEEETKRIRETLKTRQDQYYKHRTPKILKDKVVIIVDDGIATGNTIMATAQLVHGQQPQKVIVAVPVAPYSTIHRLEDSPYIDEVVCILSPTDFRAVGQYYKNFDQVSDQEAIKILEEFTP
ncbi:phosphoribosyltransferase [Maribacter sp. CXY002]|uniref:phosphoribosyltransferase n=1 Tax=Maribacter luteocoastalis TaxID=3407671 RepID=UPI003B67BB6F